MGNKVVEGSTRKTSFSSNTINFRLVYSQPPSVFDHAFKIPVNSLYGTRLG